MLIFAESGEFPARSSIDGEKMRHEEFKIGMEFTAAGSLSGRWRCTDVGTRAIVAIQIEPGNDPSWCDGPPYAVAEFVFDEDDFPACNRARSPDVAPNRDRPCSPNTLPRKTRAIWASSSTTKIRCD